MKKFFSLIGMLLVFSGCADLSVSDEQALENELPKDFNWKVYAEINNDVKQSQLIFDIQAKISNAYTSFDNPNMARKEDCTQFLKDNAGTTSNFAENIYLNYAGCPRKGWLVNETCPGVYAQVEYYNTPNRNGNPECNIAGCWSGGWDEPFEGYECEYEDSYECNIEYGVEYGGYLVNMLPTKINSYLATSNAVDAQLTTICKFVLPNAKNLAEAEAYLENFHYDSTLVKQHYFMLGRNEGRPYKYCEKSVTDDAEKILRDRAMALKLGQGSVFYDYGEYLFCLDTISQGIYLLK